MSVNDPFILVSHRRHRHRCYNLSLNLSMNWKTHRIKSDRCWILLATLVRLLFIFASISFFFCFTLPLFWHTKTKQQRKESNRKFNIQFTRTIYKRTECQSNYLFKSNARRAKRWSQIILSAHCHFCVVLHFFFFLFFLLRSRIVIPFNFDLDKMCER